MQSLKDFVTTPIVAKSEQQAGTPAVRAQSKDLCDQFQFSAALDIDTAYARAMRNFGFRTLEERKRAAEQNSIGMMDQNFRHTAQPGAMYRMTDYNTVDAGKIKYRTWTSMELWKEAAQSTAIRVSFCALRTDGTDATKAAIKSAYTEAFR
jgi:hypothetical protein